MNKIYYTTLLKMAICIVVFRKKNGEERTMHCTLQDSYIKEHGLAPAELMSRYRRLKSVAWM